MKTITARVGPGTSGLLSCALPTRFEDDLLTLAFAPSAEMSKKMCESNGRLEQVQSLLSEHCQANIKIKLEIAVAEQAESAVKSAKTSSQKQNEIVNDPAVKTVIMELGATITGIDDLKK